MKFLPFKQKNIEETPGLKEKVIIIEALVFALPLSTLLYILFQGNYDFDLSQCIMFIGIAVFILAGMIILRQILGRVSVIAMSLKKAESGSAVKIDIQKDVVELNQISLSLNNLLRKLEQVSDELAQRSSELSIIGDLTELMRSDLSVDEQMGILLEKCMGVTGARIGSVLMVEPETRQSYLATKTTPISVAEMYHFRVCAIRGHSEELKIGAYIDIEKSLIKAVLLEKAPLLIHDISSDPRTSKANDPKYGSPSFLSMPVVSGDSVLAIVNLAHKEKEQLFDENDEKILAIILRDMGFALENAMLRSRIRQQLEQIKKHDFALEREIEKRRRLERRSKIDDGKI